MRPTAADIGQVFVASWLRRRDGATLYGRFHSGAEFGGFIHFATRKEAREQWPAYQAAREAGRSAAQGTAAQLGNKSTNGPILRSMVGRDPAPSCVIDRK